MNALKNFLFLAILLAALGGVYVSLNRPPEKPLPTGLTSTTTSPQVEIPGMSSTAPPFSPTSATPAPGGMPNLPASPPTMTMPSPPASPPGGEAPPFVPPTSADRTPSGPSTIAPPYSPGPVPTNTIAAPTTVPTGPTTSPGTNDPFGGRNSLPGTGAPGGIGTPNSPLPAEQPAPINLSLIRQRVDAKIAEGKLGDALLVLSQIYGSPDISPEDAAAVTQLLDQMAATVIYSRQHLLESAYLVQAGDTLERIADSYQVPPQLLARINGLRDPQNLPPGKELKVVKGPFSAQISTARSEMTLMLDGRYAGRFPVTLSSEMAAAEGIYTVRDKRTQPAGNPAAAGKFWIDLGNQISIQNGDKRTTGRGTIWLSDQDLDDVYGILTVGSRVVIQR